MPKYILLLTFLVLATVNCMGQESSSNNFGVTKGRYFTTLALSLDQRNAENENQLVRFVIDQDRLNYRITSRSGYAVKDNMILGLGIGYGREREDITFENQNGEEIVSRRVQQGVSIAPTLRNYVPIGSGQLQILIQTEFSLLFAESLERQFLSNDIDKIKGDVFEAQLGVSPGAVLFFDRHWAFEVTVGLAGLSTRVEEEVINNDDESRTRVVSSGVDLRINLLQLNLGVAYYF